MLDWEKMANGLGHITVLTKREKRGTDKDKWLLPSWASFVSRDPPYVNCLAAWCGRKTKKKTNNGVHFFAFFCVFPPSKFRRLTELISINWYEIANDDIGVFDRETRLNDLAKRVRWELPIWQHGNQRYRDFCLRRIARYWPKLPRDTRRGGESLGRMKRSAGSAPGRFFYR